MALDPPTRTLLAVLRAQPDAEHPLGLVRELDGAGRAALLDLSRQHGLSGWAHRCFRDASIDLPADLAEALRSDHAQNTARSILALAAYRRISRILSEAGVEHIPLKGIRLLETLYPDPGTRQLGDIDVLVRKRDVECGDAALRKAGFEGAEPRDYERDRRYHQHHDYRIAMGPFEATLELHWRIVRV